jgi:hypothetical protein
MERIKTEAERIATAHPFSHPLAEGARYINKHWDLLIRFLDEPLLPPDNNAAENALRINALIRKNSMFFGSEDGADRAAVALTVLHSCRLAEIEPNSYLAQVTPALLQQTRQEAGPHLAHPGRCGRRTSGYQGRVISGVVAPDGYCAARDRRGRGIMRTRAPPPGARSRSNRPPKG